MNRDDFMSFFRDDEIAIRLTSYQPGMIKGYSI
jgi:hypothetical protein